MKVVKTIREVEIELGKARNLGLHIGFVPTMGALHYGHLNLVKRSASECDFTVVSIYVNPTQFNNNKDLEEYPRNIVEDSKLLEQVGCNLLFCPNNEQMYPDGFQVLKLNLNGLDEVMEAAFRPGHFDGVVTIVKRFFEILKPNRAYFGEKDWQQLLIVTEMTKNIGGKIKIVPCSIEREKSGLAMSSRNQRLNEGELIVASNLYAVLVKIKNRLNGNLISELEIWAQNELKSVEGLKLEYLKIVNEKSLKVDSQGGGGNLRAFVAVEIGGVRLIDNMRL